MNWSGGASIRASPSCSSYPVYCGKNSSCAYSDINVYIPIPSPVATGSYDVHANWTMRANATWSLVHHRCPSANLTNGSGYQRCSIRVVAFVYEGFVTLDDITSGIRYGLSPGSYWGSFSFMNGSSFFHDETCSLYVCVNRTAGTSPASGTRSVLLQVLDSWNATPMNSSHSYELDYEFFGGVVTNLYDYGQPWQASARGWMDVASGGNGLFLTSVWIG